MKAIFCPLPKSESLWVAGYFESIFKIKDFALPFHTGGERRKIIQSEGNLKSEN